MLLLQRLMMRHMMHVGDDEARVLPVGERVLPHQGEGDPLHQLGDAEEPEDAQHGLAPGAAQVEEDEAPEPDDAAGALHGAPVPAVVPALHADLLHLVAEELDEEHPREDQPGPQRELGRGGAAAREAAGVLGLGEEVGHDGEEEGERLGEHDADLGVEDGAGVGEAAEEVEVEEECGEEEHDDGGGQHGGLVALVRVGGRQVPHQAAGLPAARVVAKAAATAISGQQAHGHRRRRGACGIMLSYLAERFSLVECMSRRLSTGFSH
uniref:Uncharacterized protein n=1 Tax=Triticum urartu TaxID=4572 RepID=A0A8R7V287_TRIUA